MNNIIEKYPSKLHLVLTMLMTKNIRGCNIHIIYNSMRLSMENAIRPLNKYDIFEMLSLLKLLRMRDDITLQYIQSNY